MDNESSSLFHRLLLGASGNNEEQRRIGRYYFLETCASEARRFASHELIARFWKEKKETEGIWLEKSTMRVQARISQLIEFLTKNYKLSMEFVAELLQAIEDAAEASLIEGTVPYEHCFRQAKIKDYLDWFAGYADKKIAALLPFSLAEYIGDFWVAIYPFKLNPHHGKRIIIPKKIPLPNRKIPLGNNVLYIMNGHRIRCKEPSAFIFKDMENMVDLAL